MKWLYYTAVYGKYTTKLSPQYNFQNASFVSQVVLLLMLAIALLLVTSYPLTVITVQMPKSTYVLISFMLLSKSILCALGYTTM